MKIDRGLAALIARLSAGEQLSSSERAQLASFSSRKPGRPQRDDLKRFRDEFARAAAFLIARATSRDKDAVAYAAKSTFSSERRIRGAVNWLCSLSGADSPHDLVQVVRANAALAERIAVGGIEALTPKEIFLTVCGIAFNEQLEKMLSTEARARIFSHHIDAFGAAHSNVLDDTLVMLKVIAEAGGLTADTDNVDLALLVSAIASIEATAQVQKLNALLH